jgi:hypothetical protein
MIDVISDHSLADRYGVLDAITLADVLRHKAVLTRVVSDRHSAPADATDYQPLQQGRTLAWRTLATIRSDGLRVFAKAQKVLFILLPGDVAGMSILEQRPLLARQPGIGYASVRVVARTASAIYECAGITGIVQAVEGAAMRKFSPHQIAFVRSLLQPPRKQKLFLTEGLDDRAG